ncbi:hypothetical protein JKP88DRAFT_326482 [Tribonema minus]|uniref:Guanylate cyclase domain-containing protein n=1 Tax=Tribonema minus TaxID=303371 RepID=A0A835YTW3_9STRA|nr:hypothetical protein JKP88DRAFT_326482 [Tribonema minus]
MIRRQLIIQVDDEQDGSDGPLSNSASTSRSLWDGTVGKLLRSPRASPCNSPPHSPGRLQLSSRSSPSGNSKKPRSPHLLLTSPVMKDGAAVPRGPVTDPVGGDQPTGYPAAATSPPPSTGHLRRPPTLAQRVLTTLPARRAKTSLSPLPSADERGGGGGSGRLSLDAAAATHAAVVARIRGARARPASIGGVGDAPDDSGDGGGGGSGGGGGGGGAAGGSAAAASDTIRPGAGRRSASVKVLTGPGSEQAGGGGAGGRQWSGGVEAASGSSHVRVASAESVAAAAQAAGSSHARAAAARSGPNRGHLSKDVARLRRFVPDLLVAFLLDHPRLGSGGGGAGGAGDFCEAACVCLDISGFSALSERLCVQGEAGLDDLVAVINSCMGSLMNLVYFYGGDVVKVAGDALYCVFPRARGGDLAHACRQAVACCVAARERRVHGLTVHAGVGAGDICFAVLGTKDMSSRWECLISGDPIQQVAEALEQARRGVAEALEQARRGEIVLHRTCWQLTAPWLKGHELATGNFRVTALLPGAPMPGPGMGSKGAYWLSVTPGAGHPNYGGGYANDGYSRSIWQAARPGRGPRAQINAGQISCLKRFVPAPVLNSMTAGTGTFDYLAEIRQVTTLFMKWDNYSPEDHRDLLSLEPYFAAVQTVLQAHEGFLRQFLVDDKGCVLIACWGVPSATYPDNCERALEAAVRAHQQLGLLQMGTSIGITTGRALCCNIGSELRCEYAMATLPQVGDVINLAARLMGEARGRVLCDSATQDNLHDRLRISRIMALHPLPEMKNSIGGGGSGRLSLGASRPRGPLPGMIGRVKLCEKVDEALSELPRRPSPYFLVVDGQAGMGKTFLIRHVAEQAQELVGTTCRVLIFDLEDAARRHVPYSGLSGLFTSLLDLDGCGNHVATIRAKLLHHLRIAFNDDVDAILNKGLPALQTVLAAGLAQQQQWWQGATSACTPTAAATAAIVKLRSSGAELCTEFSSHLQGHRKASAAFHSIFSPARGVEGLRGDGEPPAAAMGGSSSGIQRAIAGTKRRLSRAGRDSTGAGGGGGGGSTPHVRSGSMSLSPTRDRHGNGNGGGGADDIEVDRGERALSMSSGAGKGVAVSAELLQQLGAASAAAAAASSPSHGSSSGGPGSVVAVASAAGSSSAAAPVLSSEEMVEALARIFESAVAGAPAVVCLDNVHFMNGHSWRVILRLAQCRRCPCLFVLTSQPMDERRWSFAHNSPYITYDKPVRRNAQHYFRLLQIPGACARFELRNLTHAEVAEALMAMGVGAGKPLPDEVVHRVLELSGGNPYWCAEIAAYSREVSLEQFMATVGAAEGADGGAAAGASAAAAAAGAAAGSFSAGGSGNSIISNSGGSSGGKVGASFEARAKDGPQYRGSSGTSSGGGKLRGGNLRLAHMVTHRLERLSAKEQLVARHASVIGLQFSLKVLVAVLPRPLVATVRDALVELESSRFLEQLHGEMGGAVALGGEGDREGGAKQGDGQWEGVTYRFHHPLVQQTLYNLTPIRDRRKIHYAAAQCYMREDGSCGVIHYAAAQCYVREDGGRGVVPFADVAAHCIKAETSHSRVAEYATKAAAQGLVAEAYEEVPWPNTACL